MSTEHDGSPLDGWDDRWIGATLLIGRRRRRGPRARRPRRSEPRICRPGPECGNVTAYFGQFGTIAEQEGIRRYLFRGFRGDVDSIFVPITAPTLFVDRVRAEAKAGKGNIDLLIGLHGDMVTLQNDNLLRGINDVAKQVKNLPPALVKHGKLGTNTQYYLPQAQATYVMVANRNVLKYMPKGANMNALTYGQVFAWAKAIRKGTGQARFGLPANEATGLFHRFLQGFLVPSFTGGFVTAYRSKEAVQAWTYMKQLWQYTHPQSLSYTAMETPLLSGEVLLGWDHVARLKTALDQRPDDLVAFPVPAGPKARSYMPVLVGMAIPRNAPNPAGGKALMRHMLRIAAAGADPLAHRVLPGRPREAVQADLARAARGGERRAQAAEGEGRRPGPAPDRARSRRAGTSGRSTWIRSRGSSATARPSRPSSTSRPPSCRRSSPRRARPAGLPTRRAERIPAA